MEIVQKRMELMTEDVDRMLKRKLFTVEQCRIILKKRKQYEYNINGFSTDLQVFLDYVDYETKLLESVRLNRSGKPTDKIALIEHNIMKKIKELYELIIERFPDDATQCITYFKFCKQANFKSAASVAVSKLINNHSDNIEVWQLAAKWHAYDQSDISTGLNILCKGIAKHKGSKLLYTELIHLEIHNAVTGSSRGDTDTSRHIFEKQKLCVEKLDSYFKEMFAHVHDCEYFVELVQYLEEYSFTESVQKNIVTYLVDKYPYKAVTWNILAQRDRKGQPTYPSDTNPLVKITARTKVKNCIQRYKDGLKKVVESERELLYSLYINCLLKDPGVANILIQNSLKEAFEAAASENILFEKYYLQWLELVDPPEKPRIMAMAIARYPKSVELWKFNLRNVMLSGNREGIIRTFKQGADELKEKALPLWDAYINYHILTSKERTVEMIYKEGIKQPPEVSQTLKPDYLEWLATTRTTAYTREQYFMLAAEQPYCKEMHNVMFKLETTEIVMDFGVCDRIHELACEQFGKEDVEVWQNRIKYYIDFKKGRVSKEVFMQTYEAAQNTLPPVLFSDFRDKFFAMTDKSSP